MLLYGIILKSSCLLVMVKEVNSYGGNEFHFDLCHSRCDLPSDLQVAGQEKIKDDQHKKGVFQHSLFLFLWHKFHFCHFYYTRFL